MVLVNGVPAPLKKVSSEVIEFLTPWEVTGTKAAVRVIRNGVASADRVIPLRPVSPRLMGIGDTPGILHAATRQPITSQDPAAPGETLLVLAQGLGQVEPPPQNGGVPPPSLSAFPSAELSVAIGGVVTPVLSAKLRHDTPGVYELTLILPEEVQAGSHALRLSANGVLSDQVNVEVVSRTGV
jgi:uncharacterized protein (TIGR03437 family)